MQNTNNEEHFEYSDIEPKYDFVSAENDEVNNENKYNEKYKNALKNIFNGKKFNIDDFADNPENDIHHTNMEDIYEYNKLSHFNNVYEKYCRNAQDIGINDELYEKMNNVLKERFGIDLEESDDEEKEEENKEENINDEPDYSYGKFYNYVPEFEPEFKFKPGVINFNNLHADQYMSNDGITIDSDESVDYIYDIIKNMKYVESENMKARLSTIVQSLNDDTLSELTKNNPILENIGLFLKKLSNRVEEDSTIKENNKEENGEVDIDIYELKENINEVTI